MRRNPRKLDKETEPESKGSSVLKCSNTKDHELLKSLPLEERYLGNVLHTLQNSRFFSQNQ